MDYCTKAGWGDFTKYERTYVGLTIRRDQDDQEIFEFLINRI